MKLVTYQPRDQHLHPRAADSPLFGVVREHQVVRFSKATGYDTTGLGSIEAYLAGLPGTFHKAAAIAADSGVVGTDISEVRLLPAVPRPAALLDCGLSPRHLHASSRTLLRRSLPALLGAPLGWAAARAARRSSQIRFYKGNHHSVSGPGDEIIWPDFSAYLDIEPELALVTGPEPQQHSERVRPAGYVIYNDVSARDVQLQEMLFTGPASSKDFDTGNGIGPYLVTPDEVPDPLNLNVRVDFEKRDPWYGTTRDYSMHPEELLAHVLRRRSLPSATIIGMGTIPGCCGLDRDEWLEPAERFDIHFDGLGSLQQHFGTPAVMPQTRWAKRDFAPGGAS